MLGIIIGIIIISSIPEYIDLLFCNVVTEPIPTHIPCLGPTLANVILDETVSSGVICFDSSGRLRVTEGF